ncbi:MAG: MotA/TolQ/ExbB proton channel family protein [Alphaproteobacteria bacterium]|nr:MotA/TolQ/ExbB proton channel family protein [Alphaproteobacteria bacterium]
MNKSTLFGFLLGWGIVFWTIILSVSGSTGGVGMFWDFPSFLLVMVGPYFAMMMSYNAKDVLIKANLDWVSTFKPYPHSNISYKDEIVRVIHWSDIKMNGGGLKALEDEAQAYESKKATDKNADFISTGLFMISSGGYDKDEIRAVLKDKAFNNFQRSSTSIDILNNIGANSPAFGMAGTLIGLVVMLGNMGGNPESIGAGMAVALITTFYGVMSARLIYLPAGVCLSNRASDTLFYNLFIAEGIALLAEGKNKMVIQERLNALLDPSQAYKN